MVQKEGILSQDFLDKYKNKQPNWGFNGLGYIVYKRTYARLKDDNTTEEQGELLMESFKKIAHPDEMGSKFKVLGISSFENKMQDAGLDGENGKRKDLEAYLPGFYS